MKSVVTARQQQPEPLEFAIQVPLELNSVGEQALSSLISIMREGRQRGARRWGPVPQPTSHLRGGSRENSLDCALENDIGCQKNCRPACLSLSGSYRRSKAIKNRHLASTCFLVS